MSEIDLFAAVSMADMRSIATAWEARSTDLAAARSIATAWEARATDIGFAADDAPDR